MFGATKKLGEKLAVALETEGKAWIAAADKDTTTPHSMHNRYVGVVINAMARVIRDVTKGEKDDETT